MSKFAMDFSKFKKVSGDQHSTTLKHPEGHTITLSHTSLSPKMRGQLAELPMMAEGGDVPEPDKQNAADMQKGATESGVQPQKWIQNVKEGLGMSSPQGSPAPKSHDSDFATKFYAEGGDVPAVSDTVQDSPEQIASDANAQAAPQDMPAAPAPDDNAPVTAKLGKLIGEAIPGLPVAIAAKATGAAINAVKDTVNNVARGVQAGVSGQPIASSPQEAPSPANGSPSGIAEGASPAAPQQPQGPSDPYGTQAYYDNYTKGLGEQKAGAFAEANAIGKQGQQEAQVADQSAQKLQSAQDLYKQHYDQLDKERQAFQDDLEKQHINPNAYMDNMSTAGRIKTAIGLILGGTDASKFLNDQINRNISAQQADINNKQTLLAANMKQFGNLKDATDMTRVMQMDIMSAQLKKAAATAMGPIAQARALQAAGNFDKEASSVLSQIAMRKSLMSGMQQGSIDPSSVIRMVVPEGQQQAAYKELQSAQNMVKGRDNLMGAFDQLSQINTVGNRVTSPIQTPKQVEAIKGPLLAQLVKDSEGRITPQDVPMIGALFPAPGDDAQTQAVKRAKLNSFVSEKMNFPMLKSYGIDIGNAGRYNGQGKKSINLAPPVAPVAKK